MKTEEQIIQETAGDLADKFPNLISALSYQAYQNGHSSGQEEVMWIFEDLMSVVFDAIRKDLGKEKP